MIRMHIVSLPHTLLTKDYCWCAYTAKVWRLTKMLRMAGHEAIVYGSDIRDPEIEIDAFEYVPIITAQDRERWFGVSEWPRDQVFNHWNRSELCWQEFNASVAIAIRNRWQPQDILGIIAGGCQFGLVLQLNDIFPLVCEWGIGYSGVLHSSHKVYESYAWAHYIAGLNRHDDISYFDTVIPNCFDVNDLIFSADQGDYLLYMGRPIARKGLQVIAEIAKRINIPVKIAGQPGNLIPNTEYVGIVTGQEKAELLTKALAVLTPTNYLEPFGGVAVESMLSGTPVISTDWGAFTETVIPGVTGYRCRSLSEFLNAVDKVRDLNRTGVRQYAEERYTLDIGSRLYDEYLRKLTTLGSTGWYNLASLNKRPGSFISNV